MAFSFTPERRHDPELMDEPGLPVDEVADAYRVLEKVNRQFFGGRRPIARELDRYIREFGPPPGAMKVLDVGSGSGDLASFSARILGERGILSTPIVVDLDPTAVLLAKAGVRDVILGNALRLPFPDASVEVVMAVKFAHHFHGEALRRLVAEMARVARDRVIVLDIRRHWLAYGGFVAWSRVFTSNRLVRNDGPLSVLRGFTRPELLRTASGLDAFFWQVRPYAGFQLALVGSRRR